MFQIRKLWWKPFIKISKEYFEFNTAELLLGKIVKNILIFLFTICKRFFVTFSRTMLLVNYVQNGSRQFADLVEQKKR